MYLVLGILSLLTVIGLSIKKFKTDSSMSSMNMPTVAPPSPLKIQHRVAVFVGLRAVSPQYYGGWDGVLDGPMTDIQNYYSRYKNLNWYDDLILLNNEKATKSNILNIRNQVFQKYENTEGVVLLDIIHSHHGGQFYNALDKDGDKLTETFCLWDGQLPDDVYREALESLGKQYMIRVISDTCHAGGYHKLFNSEMILPQYNGETFPKGASKAMPIEYNSNCADNALKELPPSVKRAKTKAAIMYISACAEGESSQDLGAIKGGYFSYCFLKALDQTPQSIGKALEATQRQTKGVQTPQIKFNTPTAQKKWGDLQSLPFFI